MKANYELDTVNNWEIFELGDTEYPLNKYIKVTLKPEKKYKSDAGFQVYTIGYKDRLYHQGGKWDGDKISFWTRNFGKFTIAADSVPPKIIPVRTNQNDLMFKITDNLSGIDSFECTINGEWVLMHYDYKRALIWSEKLIQKPFSGKVSLKVIVI